MDNSRIDRAEACQPWGTTGEKSRVHILQSTATAFGNMYCICIDCNITRQP
jgi:hypothetical protein